jgi:ABC-2 type transport system ATP-binding protein
MLLEISHLTKTYRGRVRANDGITLGIEAGEVYGLLGHNGAGKTTLVNQIVGLARPDSGSIRLDGIDLVAHPGLARRACSVQPQAQVPINGLTARQAIDLVGRMRGGRPDAVRRRVEDLAARLEIEEWLDTDGARLSGGVKRLVSFAMAAVAPGRLAILDEPTNDVDPVRRRHLWAEVRELARRGSSVLLVTHNVIEAERSVDRLAILHAGRVVAEGTPAQLKASLAGELRLDLTLDPGAERPSIPSFASRVIPSDQRLLLAVPFGSAAHAAAWAAAERRAGRIDEFYLGPATLEDVYVDLASEPAEGPSAPAIHLEEGRSHERAA